MSEPVQFWLDNKMSAGFKVAAIGDQLLVSYRERFYVVQDGAALTKGGKAQQYSKSSLPLAWRKALAGKSVAPPAETEETPLPTPTLPPRRERSPRPKPAEPVAATPPVPAPAAPSPAPPEPARRRPLPQKAKAPAPSTQETVPAACPYCSHRHDLSLEKRKGGKAFFVTCERCEREFAVRFVQVTMYQAQVAGFN